MVGSALPAALLNALLVTGVIGTGVGTAHAQGPEPSDWFVGDMHVHVSCGGPAMPVQAIYDEMVTQDLAVVTLLADMGNGEVQDPVTDLPRVNGQDDPLSTPGRILHWDAEWHWDAVYTQYQYQALGGHLVALGLTNAYQIFEEYTYPIFDWAHQQGALCGFAHFQYLDAGFPENLTCCTPVEYPVEMALGACDFISEDVNGSDGFAEAYYRLLNCGFRPGFAAGSDHPCNAQVGSCLTYVQIPGGVLTYRDWIDGIAAGRTVVSRIGRDDFLLLTVNTNSIPGDEIGLAEGGTVDVEIEWTGMSSRTGDIELVKNGVVIDTWNASVMPGVPAVLTTSVGFAQSGWLCARLMGDEGHELHTAAVFVLVDEAPIRASLADALFYVDWMDNLIERTEPGGIWSFLFPSNIVPVQARYQAAKAVFEQIAVEAAGVPSGETIWPSPVTPAATDPDTRSTEVGTKFRSTAEGHVTGIRFYKDTPNTGVHTGSLWTSTGVLLGRVVFSNESASGWQERLLPHPVPITPDTTYIVSYYAPFGRYSIDVGYFADGGVTNGPLIALQHGEEGGNGVYHLESSAFPTESEFAANYWVDVVFDQQAAADTTAPAVVGAVPVSNATNVVSNVALEATFNEAMDPGSLSNGTFVLRDATNGQVAASVDYGASPFTAELTPLSPLPGSATFTATVKGGPGGAADLSGNTLANDYSWSFTTEPPGGAPPSVISVSPADGSTNVSVGAVVRVEFNRVLDESTVHAGTLFLRDSTNGVISAAVYLNSQTDVAWLVADEKLSGFETFTVTAKGGPGGIANSSGAEMAADFEWSFTTGAASPYQSGPGGPIVVFTDASNPFSEYYAEILLTEGLNAFAMEEMSALTSGTLSSYDVAIVGDLVLDPGQVNALSNWVEQGGNLIAMKPDKKLAGLLGLTDAAGTLSEGYMQVDTSYGPGAGIVGETMQFHGTADLYALDGAAALAMLYTTADWATTNPAVTWRSVGTNGGDVVAFTYDLARSIVLTRQGNPAWADQDRDGLPPTRSDDLYFGNADFDPQPDWLDLDKIAIPQADEQQRFFANLLMETAADKILLPRFWYFPDGHRAVVVMTGDDHGNDGTKGRFDQQVAYSPTNGVVDRWETVRSTSYIFPQPSGAMSDAEAAAYDAQGFEIALHLNTGCAAYTRDALHAFFLEQLDQLQSMYPSLPPSETHRMHCIAWSGYTVLPEAEFMHGIRLDTSYYHYPGSWIGDLPGFMTGSGMAMRFASEAGEIIDVYQGATQMTDESGQVYPHTAERLLDRALGPEGFYGAFVANMHTDYAVVPDADEITLAALARGVPIVSARQLLTWLDARGDSSLQDIAWTNNTLSFFVEAGANAWGLEAMVPVPYGYEVNSVTTNGSPLGYRVEGVKGVQYTVFPALSADYEVTFQPDTAPPTIVATLPANGAVEVEVGSAIHVTFNEAMDAATFTTNTFRLLDAASNVVAATVAYQFAPFTAVLKPVAALAESATYTAIVLGGTGGVSDTAGNVMAGEAVWTFTTEGPDFDSPVVVQVSPLSGATGVGIGAPVTATFNEDIDAATVNTNTVMLLDGLSNTTVGVVTYDPLARRARLDPSPALAIQETYTAVLKGGASGVKDLAGNALIADYTWSFSTISELATSIWSGAAVPEVASDPSTGAIEVGLKFRSEIDGYISGIRFYRGPSNPGPHLGNLWTAAGVNLASTLFSNETATGWQEQLLPAPVPIVADTTYVVSYHAPQGGYAFDDQYFYAQGVTNSPLVALANGNGGGNGVYSLGPSSFPYLTADAANYWVDVVFQQDIGPDTTKPTVFSATPPAGSSSTDPSSLVVVIFSEAMDAGTITSNSFRLIDASSNQVAALVTYDVPARMAVLDPSLPLAYPALYTAIVKGGPAGVADLAGNRMDADFSWSFETAASSSISLWEDSAVPSTISDPDTSPIELGLKFQSDVVGEVTGIRFYKGPSNTGPHVGNLWTSEGSNLASVVFGGETSSGWQEQALPVPVQLESNTTYIVSYHAPAGRYSVDEYYFLNTGVTNGPLRALEDGEDGNNGVYRYGTTSFPNQSYHASHYWVDVVFREAPASNAAPFFIAVPADAVVPELSMLIVTNAASDVDPLDLLSYNLLSPPDGASIDAAGVITWTPTEGQGPSTNADHHRGDR